MTSTECDPNDILELLVAEIPNWRGLTAEDIMESIYGLSIVGAVNLCWRDDTEDLQILEKARDEQSRKIIVIEKVLELFVSYVDFEKDRMRKIHQAILHITNIDNKNIVREELQGDLF